VTAPATILVIASRADIAGGEKYLLTVARHLDRSRFRLLVLLPGDGPLRTALEAEGVETVVSEANYGWLAPPVEWYRFLSGLPERVDRVLALIRDREVGLVHTNSNMILDGALAARLAGVPHLYLAHIEFQPNLPIYRRLPLQPASFARLMAEVSTQVVAVSDSVARALSPPLPPHRVQVIHNGIELEAFDSAVARGGRRLRAELGLPDAAPLVTAVGRIHPDKGFDHYLEAARLVAAGSPEAHFVLVGGDDDSAFSDRLRARGAEAGLSGRFHFLGRREDIPAVLAQSDVFVLSSRREGHPFVLLEAMAASLPAVATRCGGVEETLVGGETGYLVDVGDVGALAAAVGRLVDDTDLRRRMGVAARERVVKHFTAEDCVRALAGVYEDMLREPAMPAGSFPVDLALRGAGELGQLGGRLVEVEARLRQVEHLARGVRESPLYRAARAVRSALRRPL
jgi:glycosyltransferase involved in cell wall biosynthesis